MKHIWFFTLIYLLLIYIAEGKRCPEKMRAHKTRCEAFYKCVDLPPERHVWIPELCDSGLVYEHKLGLCVLPADDWECEPKVDSDEDQHYSNVIPKTDKHKKSDYLVVHNSQFDDEINRIKANPIDTTNIEIITTKTLLSRDDNDETVVNEQVQIPSDMEQLPEGSGDGAELVELEGYAPIENKQADDMILPDEKIPTNSKIDPKLTQQLQHLSQIIDALKKNYQSSNQNSQDLRPDQLNAFLTHFNIKNNFDLAANDNYKATPISSTTMPPTTARPIVQLQMPQLDYNVTDAFGLQPETKLLLSSYFPNQFSNADYANSQILLNHPDGSFAFSAPGYMANYQDTPKITDETLQAVLELSKQMIATQNIPKVIPNPAYYGQPIIQPVIYPANRLPFHPSLFQFNPNYAFANRPLSNNQHKKHSATVIQNNVHVSSSDAANYNMYTAAAAADNQHKNNYISSFTTVRPTVSSTQVSVSTALPLDYQASPVTISNLYTPSPYLSDYTANSVFKPNYHKNNYQQNYLDRPPTLFPTQIAANKVNIRPNSQKYESLENDADEGPLILAYNNQQSSNAAYYMPPSTTRRPSISYSSYSAQTQAQTHPVSFENNPLVHFAGSFIPYDAFQKSILPFLGKQAQKDALINNVEYVNCVHGVRQANMTDCRRYYVCSKQDDKIISYSCPPYTAFNPMTHICDAQTYTDCNSDSAVNSYGLRRRDHIVKAASTYYNDRGPLNVDVEIPNNFDTYLQSQSVFSSPFSSSTTTTTTASPVVKKRKYYCKEGDKVADQTSSTNYFLCYKNSHGRMKGHKMSCPSGLLFCTVKSICTLKERCLQN